MNGLDPAFWRRLAAGLLVSALLGFPAAFAQKKQQKAATNAGSERGKGEGDNVRRREEWFLKQRRYPLGHIPGGARQQAVERTEQMRRERDAKLRGTIPSALEAVAPVPGPIQAVLGTWTPIGPKPTTTSPKIEPNVGTVSGRVTAMAVDPNDANIIYLGGAQGGVWKSTDGGATWAPMTDTQKSLAIGAIAIDASTSPETVYAGTGELNFAADNYYGVGVLKSKDGGSTWTQLGAKPGSVQSKNPNVTSFVGPFNVAVGGSFFSEIAINPANPNLILAGARIFESVDTGTSSGIYCSDNGGTTWTQVVSGAVGTSVVYDPGGKIAYAALGTDFGDAQNGVYKTSVGDQPCATQAQGTNWAVLPTGTIPSGLAAGRISLTISPSTPTTLYAAVADGPSTSGNLNGVYKTINSGVSWTKLTLTPADPCSGQCFYDMVIKVHPFDPNTVFFGGSSEQVTRGDFLIRSTNGGTAWSAIAFDATNELHVDQHAIAFALNASKTATTAMFVGTDGGVWSTPLTTGGGTITWNNRNQTLSLTQFFPGMSIHPSSDQIGLGGNQDNGTQKFDSVNNGTQWTEVNGSDGGYTVIDPLAPSTVYATTEFAGFPGFIDISLTNGDLDASMNSTFTIDGTNGININDLGEFIPPLVLGPPNAQKTFSVLYFGTCVVYQSTNGASSWFAISPILSGACVDPAVDPDITTIAPAADGKTVYAGLSNGEIHVTTTADAGMNAMWASVTFKPLPNRTVTMIVVDPANAMTAYAGFSGFSGFGDNVGHIFKTVNGGGSWTDISGTVSPLPNTPVNDIALDPADPMGLTIYVGTDVGVFGTTDGGLNWTPTGNGLPMVAVLSLKIRDVSRTLRAGTHGRGAWDIQLPGLKAFVLTSISPTSGIFGSTTPITLTVNGNGFTVNSTIQFNGAPLTTMPVSATQLTATLGTAQLATGGAIPVNITDPGQGSSSNSLVFSVIAPVPTLTSIMPSSVAAGSGNANMTITGTNFSANSVVHVNSNGGNIVATVTPPPANITPTTIMATIPAIVTANAGVYPITVLTPPPGGGETDPTLLAAQFTVTTNVKPPNDNFANAITATANFTDMQDNFAATIEATDPSPSCVQGSPGLVSNGHANSIWYKFIANGPGNVEADTIGSLDDTILEVVSGAAGAFTEIVCNDDINPGVIRTSQVNFTAMQGTTYFFMVSSFDGFGGKVIFNLNSSIAGPTNFTLSAAPKSATVTRPQSAVTTLTVSPNMALFPGDVTFSCLGLPTESTCIFNPSRVLQASGATQVTVTITTVAPSSVPPAPRRGPGAGPFGLLLWALAALSLFGLFSARRAARRWRYAFSAAVVVILVGLAMSCGGGGGGGGGGGNPGSQPLGANMVMIKANSGNVSQTVPFTLTLQ